MTVQRQLLTETIPLVMSVVESAETATKKFVFRGRVGVVGAPTLNKRRYSESLIRRELSKLGEAMKSRRLLGELDHPDDGRTRLTRASHVITSWRIEGNDLIAEFEPLPTPNGKILRALGEAGVQVGSSIRGWGSTRWNKNDGVEDVGEDYELKTFDVVYEPAAAGAYPQMVAEAIEAARRAEEEMDLAELKKNHSGLYEEIVSNVRSDLEEAIRLDAEQKTEQKLRAEFSVGVRKLAEGMAGEAKKRAVSEALSDPSIAAAKVVVEQIAQIVAPWTADPQIQETLREKEEEIRSLREQLAECGLARRSAEQESQEMAALSREAAYHVVMERALRGESDSVRETVLNLVGNVNQFDSRQDLEERLTLVRGQLAEAKGETGIVPADQIREDLARVTAENEQLRKLSEEAVEKVEEAAVQGYLLGVSSRHAKGDLVLKIAGSAKTIEEAKTLIEQLDQRRPVSAAAEELAEKIRRQRGKGKERDIQEDTEGPAGRPTAQRAHPPIPGFDLEEFRRKIRPVVG